MSPALVKVVAGQGGRLLQPAVYKTKRDTQVVNDDSAAVSVADASSWSVLSWVEGERFGLVSELSPDNFSRYVRRATVLDFSCQNDHIISASCELG